MQKTILFMDNDSDFLDVHSRLLEQAGYDILRATSIQAAETILQERYVHLAILDIRMEDEYDAQDISGLKILEKDAYRFVPKIILTAYPSWEYAEKALGAALGGLQLAGMIGKAGGPETLIQLVAQVFAQRIHINWDLTIRYSESEYLSLPHIITLIEPKIAIDKLPFQMSELEDLFRRLFHDSVQITISHIFAQQEGRVFLAVFAYSPLGMERQYMMVCGRKSVIEEEEAIYEKFVPKKGGQVDIIKDKAAETLHFAATAYILTGGNLDEISTLRQFYRRNSTEMVITTLSYLFNTTLAAWHEQGRFYEEGRRVNDFYLEWLRKSSEELFSPTTLEHRMEALCREILVTGLARFDYSPQKLIFRLPNDSSTFYPNPSSQLSKMETVFVPSTIYGVTHGKLNGDSVLTDRQGRTWLIDFNRAGQGPLLHDFVSLETAVKFDLLDTLDVLARYEMENQLLTLSHLDEVIKPIGLPVEVEKVLQVINYTRILAASIVGQEINSYLGGLLFCAIGHLTRYDPHVQHSRRELIPYLHSLLSAAMLCQQLFPVPRKDLPPQALHSLWIDELNKEVWVEGEAIHLTPQEFDFLLYLYNHQGQLCSRENIAEHVFGAEYKAQDMSAREKNRLEETRLNSTISRLRRKIEPDPETPKYITVIRGGGYKLELPSYTM